MQNNTLIKVHIILTLIFELLNTGIEEHSRPSDEYLETRFELCKKLMALAGYRLADNILKNIHNF